MFVGKVERSSIQGRFEKTTHKFDQGQGVCPLFGLRDGVFTNTALRHSTLDNVDDKSMRREEYEPNKGLMMGGG